MLPPRATWTRRAPNTSACASARSAAYPPELTPLWLAADDISVSFDADQVDHAVESEAAHERRRKMPQSADKVHARVCANSASLPLHGRGRPRLFTLKQGTFNLIRVDGRIALL